MFKKEVVFLLLMPLALLQAQVYNPAPHVQKHKLPRGAYVACLDDITSDMASGSNKKYQELVATVDRHQLQFLAFYGLHHIVDDNPQDNQEEAQLRIILSDLRNRFPKLEIGAVGGGLQDPGSGKIRAQQFEQLQTGSFIFDPGSDEACPQDFYSTYNLATLNKMMNPVQASPSGKYRAEVLKFFARIAMTYGFSAPNLKGHDELKRGKQLQASQDYFDHLVLEDEWWWRSGSIRANLNDHENLLRSMRSILQLSNACEAKVISYESIQKDSIGLCPLEDQAREIAELADRVLVTHYFKCVPNTLDRYCEAVEAWGKTNARSTEFWPLFSSEDQSARVACSRFNPAISWNDFWGEWMDTSYTANNPPPDLCPNPGLPQFGYPYETDEAEDLYLARLDSAIARGSLPGSPCPQFDPGDYQARGFMWFIAHLMDPHGRSKVGQEEYGLSEPQLYPNPAQSEIQLSKGKLRSLHKMDGQQFPLKRSSRSAWSIDHLPKGIYIAEVEYIDQLFYLRFLKK